VVRQDEAGSGLRDALGTEDLVPVIILKHSHEGL
jgi:hypothetical protein